jgi:glycosyltransferase involved in cell wall biosynthesis
MPDKVGSGAGARPIHVLEIVGNAIVGGMERYVGELVRHLPSQAFRFTCLAPFESPFTASLRELGCDVFIAAMGPEPAWRSIQIATELIHTCGVDLLHAHLPRAHVLAGLVARLADTPCLATVHERYASDQMLAVARLTGTHLLTVCQEAYFHALAQGIPVEQVSLIPNGVDTERFAPRRTRAWLRRTLGVPADAPLVGCVARLSPEKGVDRFIRAAERIHRQRPDVHFAVIGAGYQHRMLTRLAHELGLAEHLHLPGVAMDAAMVYPGLDLVALTSRSEGMPLVLLEAMACARPVVAMRIGGVAEVIEAGTTGVLVERNDWHALAGAVVDLLGAPERLRELGAAGRRRVRERFSLESTLRRTEALFEQLVRAAGRRSPREVISLSPRASVSSS